MIKLRTAMIFFLLTLGASSFAQEKGAANDPGKVFKFLTTGFSVMEKDEKGDWGKWSELKPASIVITLDTKKGRILIYSQEVQLYDIINYEKIEENDNDIIYPFTCTDDDGRPFTISIITRKKQGNRKQLYITEKNTVLMYNIINYPDKNIEVK